MSSRVASGQLGATAIPVPIPPKHLTEPELRFLGIGVVPPLVRSGGMEKERGQKIQSAQYFDGVSLKEGMERK